MKYPIRSTRGARDIIGMINIKDDEIEHFEQLVGVFVEKGETPPPLKLEYSYIRSKGKFNDFFITFQEATSN